MTAKKYAHGTLAERFWRFVDKKGPEECWEWKGTRSKFGYGKIRLGGRGTSVLIASRVSYTIHFGEVPSGMFVLHHCDNKPCVNPSHLFLGTLQDNADDYMAKGLYKPRKGIKHGMAKLTDDQVIAIRKDTRLLREISQEYGISKASVSNIRLGKGWKHI